VERHGIALPADEVLIGEFDALARALSAASSGRLFGKRWRAARSSTVLMSDVFTMPKLYDCCPNYLYIYQRCALKGVPEAIVKGMGGVWDRCARPGRHISFEAGVQEAVVCWNAPKRHHADCNGFLYRALSLHFKGGSWHFTHTSAATMRRAEQSKVVQKLAKQQPKLPGNVWETTQLRRAARARSCYARQVSNVPAVLHL
jgi:hypothetical protein